MSAQIEGETPTFSADRVAFFRSKTTLSLQVISGIQVGLTAVELILGIAFASLPAVNFDVNLLLMPGYQKPGIWVGCIVLPLHIFGFLTRLLHPTHRPLASVHFGASLVSILMHGALLVNSALLSLFTHYLWLSVKGMTDAPSQAVFRQAGHGRNIAGFSTFFAFLNIVLGKVLCGMLHWRGSLEAKELADKGEEKSVASDPATRSRIPAAFFYRINLEKGLKIATAVYLGTQFFIAVLGIPLFCDEDFKNILDKVQLNTYLSIGVAVGVLGMIGGGLCLGAAFRYIDSENFALGQVIIHAWGLASGAILVVGNSVLVQWLSGLIPDVTPSIDSALFKGKGLAGTSIFFGLVGLLSSSLCLCLLHYLWVWDHPKKTLVQSDTNNIY